jgi:excisionase family DNA binding protein
MVIEGALPPPRRWHSEKLWLVSEVEAFLNDWPIDGKLEQSRESSLPNKGPQKRALQNRGSGQAHVYSPRTLAAEWQCTERHIRNLIKSGDLKAFRVGTLFRIRAEEAEEYLRQIPAARVTAADLTSSDVISPTASDRKQRKRAAARLDLPRPKNL